MSKKTVKNPKNLKKVVKVAKSKTDIKKEIEKAASSVINKSFNKKKFWDESKKRFDSTQSAPTPVAKAIAETKSICSDGRKDVINILSAFSGKPVSHFSVPTIKPKTLFILASISNNYPSREIILSSKDENGYGSSYVRHGSIASGYSLPTFSKTLYVHPTYKQFSDWFDKLSNDIKIKFIEKAA